MEKLLGVTTLPGARSCRREDHQHLVAQDREGSRNVKMCKRINEKTGLVNVSFEADMLSRD